MANNGCGDFGCYGLFENERTMLQAMCWWVSAHMSIGLSITIEKSILLFMEKNNLTEEMLNVHTAKAKYSRFNNKLIERMRNGRADR